MVPVSFLSVHLRNLIFMTIGKVAYDPIETCFMLNCLAHGQFNVFLHVLMRSLIRLALPNTSFITDINGLFMYLMCYSVISNSENAVWYWSYF